jgi:hypothetical protein
VEFETRTAVHALDRAATAIGSVGTTLKTDGCGEEAFLFMEPENTLPSAFTQTLSNYIRPLE